MASLLASPQAGASVPTGPPAPSVHERSRSVSRLNLCGSFATAPDHYCADCRRGRAVVTKGTVNGYLFAQAPKGLQLGVDHSAVLAYLLSASERDAFTHNMRQIDAVGISNEVPLVFPKLAKAPPPPAPDQFRLAVDGKAVARTRSITCFAT